MLKYIKRTMRDVAIGAALALAGVSYFALPHVDWRIHAGNRPEEIAKAADQSVAMAKLLPPGVANEGKAK